MKHSIAVFKNGAYVSTSFVAAAPTTNINTSNILQNSFI